MTTIKYGVSPVIVGYKTADDFTYTIAENPITTSGTVTTPTVLDATVTRTTLAGVANNFNIIASPPFAHPNMSYTSSNSSIATVNSIGQVTLVSSGSVTISITGYYGTRQYSRVMGTGLATTDVVTSYAGGSAGNAVKTAIDAMISGKTPSPTTKARFSSYSGVGTPTVVLNPNLFCTLNLDWISVQTDNQGVDQYPVSLITANHVLAGHTGTGSPVVFFDSSNGQYYSRTVTNIGTVVNGYYIYALNSPIPSSIVPVKILSNNYATKFPSASSSTTPEYLPCLFKHYNNGDTICIGDILLTTSTDLRSWDGTSTTLVYNSPTNSVYKTWAGGVYGGDSCGQVFIPIAGSPVLITNFFGANNNINLADYKTQIDSILAGSGYSATYVDLSAYTSF